MSTNSDDQALNGGFGSCSALYERFSHCLSFGGQLRQIHREGIAESCGDLIMDYSKCLRAQSSQDEAKKQVFMDSECLSACMRSHVTVCCCWTASALLIPSGVIQGQLFIQDPRRTSRKRYLCAQGDSQLGLDHTSFGI